MGKGRSRIMDWDKALAEILATENKSSPLTDAEIGKRLDCQAVTVNKARTRAGIGNSYERARQYGRAKKPE